MMMLKPFVVLVVCVSLGLSRANDMSLLDLSQEKIKISLLDLVQHTSSNCLLGNRSAGKLNTSAKLFDHVQNTEGFYNLSQFMLELFTNTNDRCLSIPSWSHERQIVWVTEVVELKHKVGLYTESEFALIWFELSRQFISNMDEQLFQSRLSSYSLEESISVTVPNFLYTTSANNTVRLKTSAGKEHQMSSRAAYKEQLLLYLRFLSDQIIQNESDTILKSRALNSFCQQVNEEGSEAKSFDSGGLGGLCLQVSGAVAASPDVALARGVDVETTLLPTTQSEIRAVTVLAPLLVGASTSVGSVAASVYMMGSGTGSVYLSSVGALSKLPDMLDISNMAAGPVVLALVPALSTFGSLYFALPNNIAGITSKAMAAVATAFAPVGVYSLLTLNGAGYVSIMQTLANFGGGTIISGGGGAAVGVGVLASLAGAGICAISLSSYAAITLTQTLLTLEEDPSSAPAVMPLLEPISLDGMRLVPSQMPSLLEDEVRLVFAERTRLHKDTLYWEAVEQESAERLHYWRSIVVMLGIGVLAFLLIMAVLHRGRRAQDELVVESIGTEVVKENGNLDTNDSVELEEREEDTGGSEKLDQDLEDEDEDENEDDEGVTVKGLKSLEEIERDKMKGLLSVIEYEAFLKKQKELLKCVHAEIESEVVALSFGH